MAKAMKNSELRNALFNEVGRTTKNKVVHAGILAAAAVGMNILLDIAKEAPAEEDPLYREQE